MTNQKKGAAPSQDNRANGKPAICREPRPSVAELRERDRRERLALAACTAAGFALVYVLMFMAGC